MSGQALRNPAWESEKSSSGDLTWLNAKRPDMTEKTLWNSSKELDKANWDLAAEELGLGRTCPARVTRTWPGTRISPAKLS
jgi:hypothetical protein